MGLNDEEEVETCEISLEPNDWSYKAEGSQHVILAFCGKDPRLSRHVLRLKKDSNKLQSNEIQTYKWKKKTLLPVLGEYVSLGVVVKMNTEFLHKVNERILPFRPRYRTSRSINPLATYGLLLPDFTLMPTVIESLVDTKGSFPFTVDIKPKSGIIATSSFIKKRNYCKYTTCRYCMHQCLKLQQNEVPRKSDYCPLDLYSTNLQRIKKALHNLLLCPQNNLKLYYNGNLYFTGCLGGDGEAVTRNLDDVRKILTPFFTTQESEDPLDTLVHTVAEILVKESLLTKLRALQALDAMDIEAIYYLYSTLHNNSNAEDEEIVNNKELLQKMSKEEIEKAVEEFLTAATAKDCSLMITLLPLAVHSNYDQQIEGVSSVRIPGAVYECLYRVNVVDVDPKSAANIPAYYYLDDKICSLYSSLQLNKTCVT